MKTDVYEDKEKSRKTKILLLNIAIVLAVLGLGAAVFRVGITAYYELKYQNSIYSMADAVEREEYAALFQMCSMSGNDRKKNKDYQEFYALSDYYGAASLYRAYQETGDMKRAALQKEKMDAAALKLGRLSATKSRVDAQLGL